MTPQDVITQVRRLIQDESAPLRYSDTVLLGFVNETLKRMAVLRPDLFSYIGEITTTPNTVLQSCPSDSVRLVEIFQVKDGSAITEVSRDTLDQSAPGWVSETAGTPVNYVRHVRNPNKFFVYPRPTSGIILIGEYVQSPSNYTLNQTILLLPDSYFSTVVDGTVYLAESVDNEHVNSGRAKLFFDSFAQSLGVGLQSRSITDTEEGGLDPRQVV
jgi:hypothetical protein